MPSSSVVSASLLWSLVFVCVLLLAFVVRLWLLMRQVRHVAKHRSQVPAPFAQQVPLDAHQRAADYTLARTRVGLVDVLWSTALVVGWTLLGGLDALHAALLNWLGEGLGQQLALVGCFALIGTLLELPLSLYQTFGLEQRFGFNRMSLRLWALDALRGLALALFVGGPIVAAMLWVMHAAGSWWWLAAWALWAAVQLLALWIFPTFIAPLFNDFKPLADPDMLARVQALLQRCGLTTKQAQTAEVLVMDGSRRSAHANAYFTGFGRARRVVLFDTLMQQLSPAQLEAVLAHEVGHWRLGHIPRRLAGMLAVSLLAFAVLGWLSTQAWFYAGLGVAPTATLALGLESGGSHMRDMAALAVLLFLLVLPSLGFFFTPLMACLSRRDEFEADAWAAKHASAADLAAALVALHRDNASTLTPDPVFAAWYHSHPSALERVQRLLQATSTLNMPTANAPKLSPEGV